MSMTDPIADMLVRIRNAAGRRQADGDDAVVQDQGRDRQAC